jgi:hypothetical protein
MNAAILRRLAALEQARPTERKPVDERALMARITMTLAGGLTGLARALQLENVAELFHTAFTDRADFCRRYAAVSPPAYHVHQVHPSMAKDYRDACDEAKAKEAGDVCDVVIREFLAEEMANQVVDAVFPFWRRPNAKAVEVPDEVLSDIGRSLLRLAARDKVREGRTPFAPANQGGAVAPLFRHAPRPQCLTVTLCGALLVFQLQHERFT